MMTTRENKRTRNKEETARESWSSHNLRVGTPQSAGCERAYKIEAQSLAAFAHKLHIDDSNKETKICDSVTRIHEATDAMHVKY